MIGTTSAANNILDVRFFGSHDMAKVNAHDCYIYPSKNPNRSLSEKIEEEIKDCAMVCVSAHYLYYAIHPAPFPPQNNEMLKLTKLSEYSFRFIF